MPYAIYLSIHLIPYVPISQDFPQNVASLIDDLKNTTRKYTWRTMITGTIPENTPKITRVWQYDWIPHSQSPLHYLPKNSALNLYLNHCSL